MRGKKKEITDLFSTYKLPQKKKTVSYCGLRFRNRKFRVLVQRVNAAPLERAVAGLLGTALGAAVTTDRYSSVLPVHSLPTRPLRGPNPKKIAK